MFAKTVPPQHQEIHRPLWTRMVSSGMAPIVLSAIKHFSRLLDSSALRSRSLCRYCLPGVNETLPHLSSLRPSGNFGAIPRCNKNCTSCLNARLGKHIDVSSTSCARKVLWTRPNYFDGDSFANLSRCNIPRAPCMQGHVAN